MASYKINGYSLETAFGIHPDGDKTMADSFESFADPVPGYSFDWGNGVIEYDLASPVHIKPKVLTIKGTLVTESIDDYQLTKMALSSVLYQNYVTLEEIELGLKYNARFKPDGNTWHRLTNLNSNKILVAIQFQFDEVKQNVPYKDDGSEYITFLVDNQLRYYNTQDNRFITI